MLLPSRIPIVAVAIGMLLSPPILRAGPEAESVVQQYLAFITNYTEILADIADAPSAEAAEPKLKDAAEVYQALRPQLEVLSEPTDATAALREKYAKPMQEAMTSFQAQQTRLLQTPELGAWIEPLLEGTFGSESTATNK